MYKKLHGALNFMKQRKTSHKIKGHGGAQLELKLSFEKKLEKAFRWT